MNYKQYSYNEYNGPPLQEGSLELEYYNFTRYYGNEISVYDVEFDGTNFIVIHHSMNDYKKFIERKEIAFLWEGKYPINHKIKKKQ